MFLNVAFHNKYSSKVKKEQADDNAKEKLEYFTLFFDLEILSNTNKYLLQNYKQIYFYFEFIYH